MKLTERDRAFMEALRGLLDCGRLWVELKRGGWTRFVLRRNYGVGVEARFGVSRQGVRWRFQRVMDAYVSAYETILWVETALGGGLRGGAMEVARERAERRRRCAAEEWRGGRGGGGG